MTSESAPSETPRHDRLAWDLVLLVTFAVMALILGPLLVAKSNNLWFQAGRTNDLTKCDLAMAYAVLELPTAAGLLLLLFIMLVRVWVKWRRSTVRLARLRLGMLLLMVGLFVVPFLFLSPGVEPLSRGFQQWARGKADVEAVRTWAGTLQSVKSNACIEPSLWPPAVARLSPRAVYKECADTVKLFWGGGFIGAFGIIVGPSTLATPETNRQWRTLDLAPGAYVFMNNS